MQNYGQTRFRALLRLLTAALARYACFIFISFCKLSVRFKVGVFFWVSRECANSSRKGTSRGQCLFVQSDQQLTPPSWQSQSARMCHLSLNDDPRAESVSQVRAAVHHQRPRVSRIIWTVPATNHHVQHLVLTRTHVLAQDHLAGIVESASKVFSLLFACSWTQDDGDP